MEGPAAKTADRLVAARAGKTLWLVTFFGRWEARSATEATMEPPATKSRNEEVKIPDGRLASIGLWGAERGAPYIDRREEKRIRRYIRDRTGSALAPMWVDVSAELGRHECGCWRRQSGREHDSNMRLLVSTRGPSRASSRRITPGFILRHDPPPAR
jgi:hypothetical protein